MGYLSIYSNAGERVASLVTGLHGETMEALRERAEKEYPSHVYAEQTEEEYLKAISGNLLYMDWEYKSRPAPSQEERRRQAMKELDNQYTEGKRELARQYLDAMIHGDSEAIQEIKAEITGLDAAYDKAADALMGDDEHA